MSSQNQENPGCFGFIINMFRDLVGASSKTSLYQPYNLEDDLISLSDLPYRLRDDFLSPAELSYYKVLSSVLGPKGTICVKVRLADVLFVPRSDNYVSYFNRISQRHVDFLLCDSYDMRPVLAIELDDGSHHRADRESKDQFFDEAFQAAGLPLLRVTARRQYSQNEVISQLKPLLPRNKEKVESTSHERAVEQFSAPTSSDGDPPICPKCGVPMVLKTATKGKYQGTSFYGCPNFPKCKQLLPVSSE
jgi:hypothetical protein